MAQALNYGLRALSALELSCWQHYPPLGLQRLRVAKLCLFLGDRLQATHHAQQALRVLDATHGSLHPLYSMAECVLRDAHVAGRA